MAVTSITICNVALLRLGITRQIASLSDGTAESIPCLLTYDRCRARTLEDFHWPFASRYVALGAVVETFDDTDPEFTQWRFSYRYPTSCARVVRFVTAFGTTDPDPPAFALGTDATGRLILTDVDPGEDDDAAIVEYTHDITDTALFTETFASALSWLIAFEIAPGLRVDAGVATAAYNMYVRGLRQAIRQTGNEERMNREADGPLLRSRTGGIAGGIFGGDGDNPYYPSGFVV